MKRRSPQAHGHCMSAANWPDQGAYRIPRQDHRSGAGIRLRPDRQALAGEPSGDGGQPPDLPHLPRCRTPRRAVAAEHAGRDRGQLHPGLAQAEVGQLVDCGGSPCQPQSFHSGNFRPDHRASGDQIEVFPRSIHARRRFVASSSARTTASSRSRRTTTASSAENPKTAPKEEGSKPGVKTP